jgi:cell wall-associated NlpC family hydrolase
MPIHHAAYAALLVASAFAIAPCFAAEVDAAPQLPSPNAAPSHNIFTSWFSGKSDSADVINADGQPVAAQPAASSDLVGSALGLLGISYRFGGNTPASGFDCSGMVRYVFQNAIGLSLPRRAEEISHVGTKVGRNDLKPGDLVFYKTLRRAFSHVGIYLGNNRFIHAPSAGGTVRVDDMTEGYWAARFNGARRVDS